VIGCQYTHILIYSQTREQLTSEIWYSDNRQNKTYIRIQDQATKQPQRFKGS
jgi:hypothetical protein